MTTSTRETTTRAWIYDVRMAQFVLKIEKLSHIMGPRGSQDLRSPSPIIGSFSKPRRRRQRERHQTKGLMSRTIAVHVRFESLYISLPSSAKQQREMTKFYVFWSTLTAMVNVWYLL